VAVAAATAAVVACGSPGPAPFSCGPTPATFRVTVVAEGEATLPTDLVVTARWGGGEERWRSGRVAPGEVMFCEPDEAGDGSTAAAGAAGMAGTPGAAGAAGPAGAAGAAGSPAQPTALLRCTFWTQSSVELTATARGWSSEPFTLVPSFTEPQGCLTTTERRWVLRRDPPTEE
jgi:hypothetical protein